MRKTSSRPSEWLLLLEGREKKTSRMSLALAVACAVAIPHLAGAQADPRAAAALSAEQIVAARRASMIMSAAILGSLKDSADRGADVKGATYPAAGLARWAKVLPAMFPEGTGPGQAFATRARTDVWAQRASFERSADELTLATGKLRELAFAGDPAGFKSQIGVVQAACESCHEAYRTP